MATETAGATAPRAGEEGDAAPSLVERMKGALGLGGGAGAGRGGAEGDTGKLAWVLPSAARRMPAA